MNSKEDILKTIGNQNWLLSLYWQKSIHFSKYLIFHRGN